MRKSSSHIPPPLHVRKKNTITTTTTPNSPHIKKQQHWLSTTEETGDDGGGGGGDTSPSILHRQETESEMAVGSLRLCVTGWQGVKRKTKIYIERGREEGIKREKERVALFFLQSI